MAVEGCLGLCSPSNVAVLSMRGGNQWFGRINSRREVGLLLDYVAESVDRGMPAPPQGELARHALRFR